MSTTNVATQGQSQTQNTGKETEETGDVCDDEEEPVGTGTPVCSKRRNTDTATSAVMEHIEHRIAAQAHTQKQLLEKVNTLKHLNKIVYLFIIINIIFSLNGLCGISRGGGGCLFVAKNITFRFSAGRGLPVHPQDSTPYYVGDMFSIEQSQVSGGTVRCVCCLSLGLSFENI